MSRWQDNFNNHRFQAVWKEIVLLSKNLKAPDQSVLIAVQELARLKKVVIYIDEIIHSCDYELIPEGTWDSFAEQVDLVDAQLKAFQNDLDINRFQIINKNLDNMLMYVRPYMVSTSGAAKAAKSGFEAYTKTIEESINNFGINTARVAEETNNYKTKSAESFKEIEKLKQKINTFEINLFGNQDGSGLSFESRINALVVQLNGWYEQIQEYSKKLFLDNDSEPALMTRIEKARDDVLIKQAQIKSALDNSNTELSELKSFYTKIFGVTGENGLIEGGLNDDLDKKQSRLKELSDEINRLLPGAVSAGMASEYNRLENSFIAEIDKYERLFYWALGGIFSVSFLATVYDYRSGSLTTISDIKEIYSFLLHKIPLIAPFALLAVFATRRLRENKRLQQEYAHKNALAKSYQNFRIQTEKLDTQDDKLTAKLLGATIDAISYNASVTLDGKSADNTPIHEAIESVTSIAKSFKKDS